MPRISLDKMAADQKGKVVEIHGGSGLADRLMSLGIYPGKEITKLSSFALRGPVTIKINQRVFALGHGMANKIIVEIE